MSDAAGLTSSSGPLAWTVSMSQGQLNDCHAWTFAGPLATIPFHDLTPADMAGGDLWALRQGGVTIKNGTGCGAPATARFYRADLGQAVPQLTLMSQGSVLSIPVDQEYTVSPSDPEIFVIEVRDSSPQPSLVGYDIQVDWSQGSSTGTADILSPVGKPFQLNATGSAGARDPYYVAEDGRWQTAG